MALASLGLIALLPLLLGLAALIYLDDPGPVLFRQVRLGRHHRPFTIYKFRTMRMGTPNVSTAELRAMGLSPFTRLGPWLRRTSLDELPQLLNVMRGEMSLVGPRPALPTQSVVLALRAQAGVDRLKPGVTGLAQVMGRDDLSDEDKVRRDAEYLAQVSLRNDLRILRLTLLGVLSPQGAY